MFSAQATTRHIRGNAGVPLRPDGSAQPVVPASADPLSCFHLSGLVGKLVIVRPGRHLYRHAENVRLGLLDPADGIQFQDNGNTIGNCNSQLLMPTDRPGLTRRAATSLRIPCRSATTPYRRSSTATRTIHPIADSCRPRRSVRPTRPQRSPLRHPEHRSDTATSRSCPSM